jgi:valyl-tRNA synthetase
MISTQWFVKMKPMADEALGAVRDGRTKIMPEEWVKTYNHFLENIQDWCISRQLWWGHQVPAFFCEACGHIHVGREDPTKCEKCGSEKLVQDEDVLDTWFSSGLWPFATLGWPEETPALKRFYPASDMETGYDILFFWVARMMMMGLHFMKEVPFRRVLLSGLLVDENGDKMSKVKGNVIDPLDLIHGATFEQIAEKTLPGAPIAESLGKFKKAYPSAANMGTGFPAFGTDALRLTLASYSPSSKRIALAPKRIEGYRHFANKMWNATRFVSQHFAGVELDGTVPPATSLANGWILARLDEAITAAHDGLDAYRLDDATMALYRFFWNDLCDWYVELTKPVFFGSDDAAKRETAKVLAHVLETALRALHPFAPFVTEELWQRIPRPASRPKTIALAPYPTSADARLDDRALRDMGVVQSVITAIRTIRTEHEIHPASVVDVVLRAKEQAIATLLAHETTSIRALAKCHLVETGDAGRPRGFVLDVVGDIEILVNLKGLVEPAKEAQRIERAIKGLEKDIAGDTKKLSLPSFTDKAPPEVVVETRARLLANEKKKAQLEESRAIVHELEEK